jgi:hypothetical protein
VIPTYRPAQLACAVFEERVHTKVRAQEGGVPWEETGERFGRLAFRAQPVGDGLRFEAWYDTLAVSYDARSGRLTPDTDGLVGGRWAGHLSGSGAATLTTRPFMPPELREVSDLSDALIDFLPPLASAAVAVGGRWTDSLGLTVHRLADSATVSGAVARYRWVIVSRSDPPLEADSTIRLRQRAEDEGQLAWRDDLGVIAWDRTVVIETQLSRALPGGDTHRGRVEQRIRVRRVTFDDTCR